MRCTVLSEHINTCNWSNYCAYNARNCSHYHPCNRNSWESCRCHWTIKPCWRVTSVHAFTSKVKNGFYGNSWLCSHLTFEFLRTGWQRSKKIANADVTCEWTLTCFQEIFFTHRKKSWEPLSWEGRRMKDVWTSQEEKLLNSLHS